LTMSLTGDNDVAKVDILRNLWSSKGTKSMGGAQRHARNVNKHKNSIKYSPALCPASPDQSNTVLLAALPHLINQTVSCSLSCLTCSIKYFPARCPASLLNQTLSCSLSCLACSIKYSPAHCPASLLNQILSCSLSYVTAQSNTLLLAVQPLLLIIPPLALDALPHLLTAHSAQPLLLLTDLPLLYTVLHLLLPFQSLLLTIHQPASCSFYRISCRIMPRSRIQIPIT
jgi:hypothetical protein